MKEMLTNKILTTLPDAEFARLVPLLEPVSLSAGDRLAQAGESVRFVYFPENSIVSCHAEMQDGKSAEVGLVGLDGMTGIPSLLSQRTAAHSQSVVVSGSALRMRREELERELRHADGLRQSLFAYAGEYITQVSQRAACAILHRTEQRLAVWLLLLTDRLDTDMIEITQDRIAQHLGVRRAGVTVIAQELQNLEAISYTRGHLRVVNRPLLETVACECYGALMGAHQKSSYI